MSLWLKSKRGFTLVEIMIVVAIIGLLAAIAIPSFLAARTKSQTSACQNNLRQMESAKAQYALENTNAVPTIAQLVPNYIKATPACPAGGAYNIGTLTAVASCGTHGNAP